MEQTGKIIKVLPLKSGISKSSGKEWKSQEYVLETSDVKYPTHVCFSVFGDKIDSFAIKEGENLTVSFNIDAREYEGRWYNSIQAWKVDRGSNNQNYGQPNAGYVQNNNPQPSQVANTVPISESDNLPF